MFNMAEMESIKSSEFEAMSNKIADMVTKGASVQELKKAVNQSKKVIGAFKEDEAE